MSEILSPNKYTGRRAPIRVIVLHTMEVDEGDPNVAEAVGHAFEVPSRQASAHVGVDIDSECRYVADADTAWAAPGVNNDGLQLEMAGRAGQNTSDWADADSKLILERGAQRVATWCRTYGIPARRLSNAELAAGGMGIIDHNQASQVYGGTHWDCGPNFPWASFMARAVYLVGGAVAQPQTKPTVQPVTRIHLAVDGIFGPRSKARFQQWAGAPVDSVLGPISWRAIQTKVGGLRVDGDPGPQTWKAIQRLVGATQDGDPGPLTYAALQRFLNTH